MSTHNYMEFYIAGLKYHINQFEESDLSVNSELNIMIEGNNFYDPNAVALYNKYGDRIGYIPRILSENVKSLILNGFFLKCIIIELNKSRPVYERVKCRLDIY